MNKHEATHLKTLAFSIASRLWSQLADEIDALAQTSHDAPSNTTAATSSTTEETRFCFTGTGVQYDATCLVCGIKIPAGMLRFAKKPANGHWQNWHHECASPEDLKSKNYLTYGSTPAAKAIIEAYYEQKLPSLTQSDNH